MTRDEFNKTGFCPGMGFKLQEHGLVHPLGACDFETGECEDDWGTTWPLDMIHSFVNMDGTPITRRP